MKKVQFDEGKNEVHTIIAWNFAYKHARDNFYERLAWDRAHFQRRIQQTSLTINKVLNVDHRNKIYFSRISCNK